MNSYILSSALWALTGLLTGYFLGRAGRVVGMGVSVPYNPTRIDNMIGVVVVILSIVSVMAMALTVGAQRAQVECQTRFNEQFIAAFRERTDAASAERNAQREFLLSIVEPGASTEAEIREYVALLEAADNRREANPLPTSPNCEKGRP